MAFLEDIGRSGQVYFAMYTDSALDTTGQKQVFQSNLGQYYDDRIKLEKRLAAGFPGLWKGTKSQDKFTSLSRSFMKSKITDPELLKAMLPEFEAGCRRFTPGGHYLDALQKPNAVYVKDSISELTANSLITGSGKVFPCDVLIFATGFEPYQPRFPVIGRGGHSLAEEWGHSGPCESYMASMIAGYPNLFGTYPTCLYNFRNPFTNDYCSFQSTNLPRHWIRHSRDRTSKQLHDPSPLASPDRQPTIRMRD
jgi:cation diffusion facilitator CzcD-associated flavoprotein CzcO